MLERSPPLWRGSGCTPASSSCRRSAPPGWSGSAGAESSWWSQKDRSKQPVQSLHVNPKFVYMYVKRIHIICMVYCHPPGTRPQQTHWCQQHPPRCHRRSNSSPSNLPPCLGWGTRRTRCRWNPDTGRPFSWKLGPPWKVGHQILNKAYPSEVGHQIFLTKV